MNACCLRFVSGVAAMLLAGACLQAAPIVIASRGASKDAPENTLPAIDIAYRMGAAAVEIDIQYTDDKIAIVMHDKDVDRTTDGTGALTDLTLADVQLLDASMGMAPYVPTPVPTLAEALETAMNRGRKVYLDMKRPDRADRVIRVTVDSVGFDRSDLFIQLWDNPGWHSTYPLWRSQFPESTMVMRFEGNLPDVVPDSFFTNITGQGFDGVSVWWQSGLNKEFVDRAHTSGLKVFSVISPLDDTDVAVEIGLDAMFTFRPDRAVRKVDEAVKAGQPARSDALAAYWSFDDAGAVADALTVVDPVGGHHGTLRPIHSSPQWSAADGKFGTALSFDGQNDYVELPGFSPRSNSLTLSAWVSLNKLPKEISASQASIFDAREDSFVFYLDKAQNELRFKVVDANETKERPGINGADLSTDVWHHVVGVYDGGAGEARIYLDGTLMDTHTNSQLVDPVRGGQTAYFGKHGIDNKWYFDGLIDDVGVWSTALSESQILMLWNDGVGMPLGSLLLPEPASGALMVGVLLVMGRRRRVSDGS